MSHKPHTVAETTGPYGSDPKDHRNRSRVSFLIALFDKWPSCLVLNASAFELFIRHTIEQRRSRIHRKTWRYVVYNMYAVLALSRCPHTRVNWYVYTYTRHTNLYLNNVSVLRVLYCRRSMTARCPVCSNSRTHYATNVANLIHRYVGGNNCQKVKITRRWIRPFNLRIETHKRQSNGTLGVRPCLLCANAENL